MKINAALACQIVKKAPEVIALNNQSRVRLRSCLWCEGLSAFLFLPQQFLNGRFNKFRISESPPGDTKCFINTAKTVQSRPFYSCLRISGALLKVFSDKKTQMYIAAIVPALEISFIDSPSPQTLPTFYSPAFSLQYISCVSLFADGHGAL